MEEQYLEERVRDRLILAGMAELEEHGLSDFSLRRAAARAQVSCAAPYRHFKDKEEYISQILRYVQSKWELLSREITRIYTSDTASLVVEMCMASLKFRIADPNVRSVYTVATQRSDTSFDDAIISAVRAYAEQYKLSESACERKIYMARALVAGTLALQRGEDTSQLLTLARERLTEEFPSK